MFLLKSLGLVGYRGNIKGILLRISSTASMVSVVAHGPLVCLLPRLLGIPLECHLSNDYCFYPNDKQ